MSSSWKPLCHLTDPSTSVPTFLGPRWVGTDSYPLLLKRMISNCTFLIIQWNTYQTSAPNVSFIIIRWIAIGHKCVMYVHQDCIQRLLSFRCFEPHRWSTCFNLCSQVENQIVKLVIGPVWVLETVRIFLEFCQSDGMCYIHCDLNAIGASAVILALSPFLTIHWTILFYALNSVQLISVFEPCACYGYLN